MPAARVQSFGPTVFAEFTALAIEHDAVNLGQGFPNFPAPDFIKEAAATAITGDLNQYARAAGHPRLVNALAQSYSPLFGRELDPLREIVVTVGATEGIFATIQALVNPGDEVILIEPFYDSYPAAVIMAGGDARLRAVAAQVVRRAGPATGCWTGTNSQPRSRPRPAS
ncbi:MAG: aminotransferase class I/II-fold pyridoxal phosphate-dependent enzyme [Caldilineaceae bacterium]